MPLIVLSPDLLFIGANVNKTSYCVLSKCDNVGYSCRLLRTLNVARRAGTVWFVAGAERFAIASADAQPLQPPLEGMARDAQAFCRLSLVAARLA